MADGRVVIEVKVPKRELTNLQTSIDELEASLDRLGSKDYLSGLVSKIASMTDGFKGTADEITGVSKSMSDLSSASESTFIPMEKMTEEASQRMEDLASMAEWTSSAIDSVHSTPLERLADAASQGGEAFSELQHRTAEASDAVLSLGSGIEGVIGYSPQLQQLGHDPDIIREAFIQAATSAGLLGEGISELMPSRQVFEQLASGTMQVSDGFQHATEAGAIPLGEETSKVGETIDEAGKSKFGESLVAQFTIANLAASAIKKVLEAISQHLEDGVKRFDTFYQFPRVMKHLGVEADVSAGAITRLQEGVLGLPTALDEIVQESRKFAVLSGDVDEAADLTLALNDALIASGSSTYDVSRGMRQYYRMLSSGEVHQRSWRALTETMPVALQSVAEAFGYTGVTATSQFYKALQSGELTMQDFNDMLIKINSSTENFHDMALDSSRGIQTSMRNIKIAFSRGIADTIQRLNDFLLEVSGADLIGWLDKLKVAVDKFFSGIGVALDILQPIASLIYEFREEIALTVGIFLAQKNIAGITRFFTSMVEPFQLLGFRIGYVADAWKSASGQTMGIAQRFNTSMKAGFQDLFDGPMGMITKIGLAVAATKMLWEAVKRIPEVAEHIKELKEYEQAIAELNAETKLLIDGNKKATDQYEQDIKSIRRRKDSNLELIDTIESLSAKENKSAYDKKELQEAITKLNEALGEEVYKYNEVTEAAIGFQNVAEKLADIQMQEAIMESTKSRIADLTVDIELLKTQRKIYEREIADLEAATPPVGSQLWKALELRPGDTPSDQLADLQENLRNTDDAISFAEEQIVGLEETVATTTDSIMKNINEMSETTTSVSYEISDAINRVREELDEPDDRLEKLAAAAEVGGEELIRVAREIAERQIQVWDDLDEGEKQAISTLNERFRGFFEERLNMFDKIVLDEALSVQQIKDIWDFNLDITENWQIDLETIRTKMDNAGLVGVDAFMEQLIAMGPEAAGTVANIAQMTDDEIVAFAKENLGRASDLSFGMLEDVFNYDLSGLPKTVTGFVKNLDDNFRNELLEIDWSVHAEDLVQGLAVTILNNSDKVIKEVTNMARDMDDAFTKVLEIRSPSRVFMRHGDSIMTGLRGGIEKGRRQITTTITRIINDINQGFSSGLMSSRGYIGSRATSLANYVATRLRDGVSGAYRAGLDTGRGFRQGLADTIASIRNTATTISRIVPNTLNSRLRMTSPSKVTRELGSFVGEGFVLGIEDWVKKAGLASDKLAYSILPNLDPNNFFTLSDRSLAGSYAGSSTVTHNSESYEPVINIERIEWSGKEDILRTMDQIGFVLGQEKWRMR